MLDEKRVRRIEDALNGAHHEAHGEHEGERDSGRSGTEKTEHRAQGERPQNRPLGAAESLDEQAIGHREQNVAVKVGTDQ